MCSDLVCFVHFATAECRFDGTIEALTVNWLHLLMMDAKSQGNDVDNLNWWHAINGEYAQEYWEAVCVEVETLEKMDAWSVMDCTPDMNVLLSTRAFKCKRFPDRLKLGSVPVRTDRRKGSNIMKLTHP